MLILWLARSYIIVAWIVSICKFAKQLTKGVNKDKIVMGACIVEWLLCYIVLSITFLT